MSLEPNARRRLLLVCATSRDPHLVNELRQVLEEDPMSFVPSADLLREIALCAACTQRARCASQSPARPAGGTSWVQAAQRAISRSKSALGTKDIGSSSSTCLSSFTRCGSREVAQTSSMLRRAFGSRLIAFPRLGAHCYACDTVPLVLS